LAYDESNNSVGSSWQQYVYVPVEKIHNFIDVHSTFSLSAAT